MAIPTSGGYGSDKFGPVLTRAPSVDPATTALSNIPTSGGDGTDNILSVHNPLVAFGAILAIAFGCMAVSTSAGVRVGRTKVQAAVNLGDAS